MAELKVAAKREKAALRSVPFATRVGEAAEVVLTGDFTEWKDEGIRLSRGSNGEWKTTLKLAPGEYQYRLRIDGQWRDHAQAEKRVPNPFGTENCVLTVQ
jgi:1,4-alpha-glucan branching enzyme